MLGDNLFYGAGLADTLQRANARTPGATIFAYYVKNPSDYGVVEFDGNEQVLSLEEKPKRPKSRYAIPGLYFYDENVVQVAQQLRPSARGELEITDLNLAYLRSNSLFVEVLGRGTAWLDTGNPEALMRASNFIEAVEQRQGLKIGCIEEVAYRMGYVDAPQLRRLAEQLNGTAYGQYLLSILDGPKE